MMWIEIHAGLADFATRLENKKIPDGCSRTVRDAKTRAIAGGYAERGPEETVELGTSGGFLDPEFFEQLQQLVPV